MRIFLTGFECVKILEQEYQKTASLLPRGCSDPVSPALERASRRALSSLLIGEKEDMPGDDPPLPLQ